MKSGYLSFDPFRTMELQKVVSGTQLVLLSDQQKVEILRPELNIEKHSSFLFPQPKTK